MAVTSPASNSSTNTPDLKTRVKQLSQKLQKMGAKDGAHRLELVEQQLQHFTTEGAFQYIRKEEIMDELENQPHKPLRWLHFFRNLFSIAPIAFTWWALHVAADAYQSDLTDAHYKAKDLYQPFLFLWQESFHGNHGFVLSFSTAAMIDAVILTILIGLFVGIPWYEDRRRDKLHASLGDFDAVIDELLEAIGQDGANSHLAPSDVNRISEAIKEQLKSVLLNYDRVTIETRDFVQKTHEKATNFLQDTHEKTTDILAYTQEKTKEVFDDFKKDLAVYNADIRLLSGGLQKLDDDLGSYGQKLNELTDASNKLAGSSNDLALNAKSMAESATLSSQASQGISTQLGALNTTQQEIVKTQKDVVQEFAEAQKQVVQDVTTSQQSVVQELEKTQRQVVQEVTTSQQSVVQQIADSQKEVVKQLTDAADVVAKSGENTKDASKEMDRVASNLEQLAQTDFQKMTDGVTQANQILNADVRKTASEIQQVANNLNGMNAQLGQSAQQLQATTQAFAQAMNDVIQKLDASLHAIPGVQQKKRGFWPWGR